jgi:hypothetical protein
MPTLSAPTAATTAATTSMQKRARFSMLPPYASVRVLVLSARNWLIRYPLAAWISTPSKPAAMAFFAAVANASTSAGSSDASSARGSG